jgi:hypothetical protein
MPVSSVTQSLTATSGSTLLSHTDRFTYMPTEPLNTRHQEASSADHTDQRRTHSDGRWASRLAVLLPNSSLDSTGHKPVVTGEQKRPYHASHDSVCYAPGTHSTPVSESEAWTLVDGNANTEAEEAYAVVARLREELEAAQRALVENVTHSQFHWKEMDKIERLERLLRAAEIRAANASTTLVSVAAAAAAAGPMNDQPDHRPVPSTSVTHRRRDSLASQPLSATNTRRSSQVMGQSGMWSDRPFNASAPPKRASLAGTSTTSHRANASQYFSQPATLQSSPLATSLITDSPLAATTRTTNVLGDDDRYFYF